MPWMTLQGAYIPASTALQVMKGHSPAHYVQVVPSKRTIFTYGNYPLVGFY
jgi:hypothetical protein